MPFALALALAVALGAIPARAQSRPPDVASHRRERVACSIAAARKFGIPANILLAIAEIEGGDPRQRVRNRNGSFDVGPMQFNTRYLEHLERRYGITAQDVAASGCYPYELAAWRLRKHLEFDTGDAWTRAANYHSRSPVQNSKYRRKLIAKAAAWARRLAVRVPTYEARTPSTGGCVSEQSRRQCKPKRQTDVARKLVPAVEDDDDDLALLVTLLNDGDDLRPIMDRDSSSIGSVHAGSLHAAVQVPTHGGYVVRDPSRAWGTADTIGRLTSAFDEVIRTDPFAPRVRVHDLSLQSGGAMRGHKSHQSGRDVDITYYRRTCERECAGLPVSAGDLDATRQWQLLRHWLERGHAEFIFIDYALQRPLYEAAKVTGARARHLARWFQYPRGRDFPSGVIRHAPGHANHVHVRFRCTESDRACQRTPTRPVPSPGDLSPLLELVQDEDESELLELLLE